MHRLPVPGVTTPRGVGTEDLGPALLRLIIARVAILGISVNLAQPLGLLPERVGTVPFSPLLNILTVAGTALYLAFWWTGWSMRRQLYLQIAGDLLLTTFLLGQTEVVQSLFVSFYLLIIVYCSLMLGRSGGLTAAALSSIFYAGAVFAGQLGLVHIAEKHLEPRLFTFLVSGHALGFFSVAFLGGVLSGRLRRVEAELESKIDTLEDLRRLHEHIVQSIRSGLITTDLEGRITLFNRTAEELTGYTRDAAVGRHVDAVLGERLWQRVIETDFFRDSRALRHEEPLSSPKDGSRAFGYSVSPLLDQNRSLIGYIISFQDLTEIRRLEEEVRRQDRMAAVGRMAAGIAHEIRNPLTAIRGSVELLSSRKELPKTDSRLLEIIIRESDRLNRFIGDFLHFARPDRPGRERLDLVPLVRDSVTLLENSPDVRDRYDVRLEIDVPELHVLGSGNQLRQVFWNLSQNALRAMPRGGHLLIQLRNDNDGSARIVFEDRGVGLSGQELKLLCQPFNSGFQGGTGLGLSIVFQIVRDHEGKIEFESEKGRGTRVTVVLPAEPAAVLAP